MYYKNIWLWKLAKEDWNIFFKKYRFMLKHHFSIRQEDLRMYT